MAGFTVSTIRVTPERLYTAADAVIRRTGEAKTALTDMSGTVQRTASFWTGEAGDSHRALFQAQVPQIEAILARFDAHAAHLKSIAANYLGAEAQITAAAEELPGDVIE